MSSSASTSIPTGEVVASSVYSSVNSVILCLLFLVLLCGVVYSSFVDNRVFSRAVDQSFSRNIRNALGVDLLSGNSISVYERFSSNVLNRNNATLFRASSPDDIEPGGSAGIVMTSAGPVAGSPLTPASVMKQDLYGVDNYPERLIVVRPNNWLIYTPNGINFYYLTNNVDPNRTTCVRANACTAVEYRLLTSTELIDPSLPKVSNRLQFACINYTYDELVRIFGSSASRTDFDVQSIFDKRVNPRAPRFTVENVIVWLVANSLV